MIFIALFLFIAVVIVALSMHNSSNLKEIESYIKNENCNNYTYSKGSYKALCDEKILEISNSFSVDIEKNSKEYLYKNIKNIDVQNLNIILNDKQKISFKQKDEVYDFYEKLKHRLKD